MFSIRARSHEPKRLFYFLDPPDGRLHARFRVIRSDVPATAHIYCCGDVDAERVTASLPLSDSPHGGGATVSDDLHDRIPGFESSFRLSAVDYQRRWDEAEHKARGVAR